MSYIDGNLLDGEHVVYRTRLHWLLFVIPVLFTVVVLLPLAWLMASGTWKSFAWTPLAFGFDCLGCHLHQTTKFRLRCYQQARNDESGSVRYAFHRASTQQDRSHCREPKPYGKSLRLWRHRGNR